MLSTFPATFPIFETGSEFPSLFTLEPVCSYSGSDTLNPSPSTGSDESDRNGNGSKTIRTCSDDPDPNRHNLNSKRGFELEERKRRRMISNRESARRSRMRKQRHLENLRSQANRLKTGNREQMNRLRMVVHQTQIFRRENEHLRTEAVMLRQRLWDIRQVLVVRQLQQLLNPTMGMGMH